MIVLEVALVIVVLSLAKHASISIVALAYRITMAGVAGGGGNFGGCDIGAGWVVGLVVVTAVVMVAGARELEVRSQEAGSQETVARS